MAAFWRTESENSQYYKAGLTDGQYKLGEIVTLQSIMEAVYTHLEQKTAQQ